MPGTPNLSTGTSGSAGSRISSRGVSLRRANCSTWARATQVKAIVSALGLSEEMFEEGYQNITNIDISHVVIKAMVEKYKDKGPNFKCKRVP